jgi:hypothetical protein
MAAAVVGAAAMEGAVAAACGSNRPSFTEMPAPQCLGCLDCRRIDTTAGGSQGGRPRKQTWAAAAGPEAVG